MHIQQGLPLTSSSCALCIIAAPADELMLSVPAVHAHPGCQQSLAKACHGFGVWQITQTQDCWRAHARLLCDTGVAAALSCANALQTSFVSFTWADVWLCRPSLHSWIGLCWRPVLMCRLKTAWSFQRVLCSWTCTLAAVWTLLWTLECRYSRLSSYLQRHCNALQSCTHCC